MLKRPADDEYNEFYKGYLGLVTEADIMALLARQCDDVAAAARTFSPDRENHAYAAGKWTVRELFGHLNDAERVFSYRAVCIARGDKASFPGFDEQVYVARSRFSTVPLPDLVEEFTLLRKANLAAFRRNDDAAWVERGTANDNPITVRAIPFIMAGHVKHHLKVLAERYAPALLVLMLAAVAPARSQDAVKETVHLTVKGGAHAGAYDATGTRGGCSYGLSGPGSWGNQLSAPADKDPNHFNSLQLIVPDAKTAAGGASEFFLSVGFGPLLARSAEYKVDTRKDAKAATGSGQVTVKDGGATGQVTFKARTADGVDLEGTIDCKSVQRAP